MPLNEHFNSVYCVPKDLTVFVQSYNISSRRSSQEPPHQPGSQHAFTMIRKRSVAEAEASGKTWEDAPEPDS